MAKKREEKEGTCGVCVHSRCKYRKDGVICVHFVDKHKARCGKCGEEIKPGDDYCIKNAVVMCGACGQGTPSQAQAQPQARTSAPAQAPAQAQPPETPKLPPQKKPAQLTAAPPAPKKALTDAEGHVDGQMEIEGAAPVVPALPPAPAAAPAPAPSRKAVIAGTAATATPRAGLPPVKQARV